MFLHIMWKTMKVTSLGLCVNSLSKLLISTQPINIHRWYNHASPKICIKIWCNHMSISIIIKILTQSSCGLYFLHDEHEIRPRLRSANEDWLLFFRKKRLVIKRLHITCVFVYSRESNFMLTIISWEDICQDETHTIGFFGGEMLPISPINKFV